MEGVLEDNSVGPIPSAAGVRLPEDPVPRGKSPRKVLIIGGGFAGLECARRLANDRRFEVTIIDRTNHHLFQPLLYQVATAGLSPGDIAEPIRSILRKQANAHVVLSEAHSIDLTRQCVVLDEGWGVVVVELSTVEVVS